MSRRTSRLEHLIQKEVSDMLEKGLSDPRLGFITITRVEVSEDLRQAVVHFSVLGDEASWRDSLEGLKSASGYLRSELARRLRLRIVPELDFRPDDSLKQGERIIRIIERLRESGSSGS